MSEELKPNLVVISAKDLQRELGKVGIADGLARLGYLFVASSDAETSIGTRHLINQRTGLNPVSISYRIMPYVYFNMIDPDKISLLQQKFNLVATTTVQEAHSNLSRADVVGTRVHRPFLRASNEG